MRSTTLLFGLLFLTPATGLAQQPPALINPQTGNAPATAPGDLPANATVDQVLDALDLRGQSMREFTARVSLTSGDKFVDGISTRTGQLSFQKKGQDDGRLRVTFDKRTDNKVTRDEKSEYLLDKGWLIDRDYRKKAETSRQVLKPGEKMNLLKLGEGPFPLPIGQKKEDVYKQFDVKLIPAAKEDGPDLADTIHIQLTPKRGTRFDRRFGSIDVWGSRKSNFPVRIDTVAPDGSDPHTTRLQDVKINPEGGLKDGDFELMKIDPKEWSLHTEPFKE